MKRIRKATLKDLDSILHLNNSIKNDMLNQGFHHWNDNYPNKEVYLKDIKKGCLYLRLDENKTVGMVSFDKSYHEFFDKANWTDKSDDFYFVHRLGILPERQGQGIAGILMDFAEKEIQSMGGSSVRLGAYKDYNRVVKFYNKRGYTSKGEIVFSVSKRPFLAMEKIL